MSTKTVMVTGAGSGIGKATASALAAQGHTVFAGALTDNEVQVIAGLSVQKLIPVRLDLSDVQSIDAAMAQVGTQLGATQPLDALVNVAGVNINAPLHILSVAEIRQTVDVNLLGTLLLTRAALPFLRRGPGRLVLVGSATAFLPPPTISVYAATKCGISGLGDSLRVELGMAGLAVSVVEPGVVRTPMTATAPAVLDRMLARMDATDLSRYEKLMRKIVDMSISPKAGVTPEAVAAVIVGSLMALKPRARYRVGVDSKAAAVLRHLPDGARDFIQRKTFGL